MDLARVETLADPRNIRQLPLSRTDLMLSSTNCFVQLFIIIIIIINGFVYRRKVVTSEALGADSMSVSRERIKSLGEEECL